MSTDVQLLPDLNQLPDDPAALKKILADLCQVVQQKTARIEQLEHQMDLLVKRLLQPSSEKIDPRQLALFADLDSGDPQVPPAEAPAHNHEKSPRKRDAHGRRRPPHTLEREVHLHDLSDAEKAALGGVENLVCIGEDITCTYEWR
ncbi:MAG: transposase, partial [Planctomycetes bacterium]|nr:transposase [Planctomycetota bacterium]